MRRELRTKLREARKQIATALGTRTPEAVSFAAVTAAAEILADVEAALNEEAEAGL